MPSPERKAREESLVIPAGESSSRATWPFLTARAGSSFSRTEVAAAVRARGIGSWRKRSASDSSEPSSSIC